MQNIFEESKATGRAVVNHKGRLLKAYTYEARGAYPVHGVILQGDADYIGQWALDGTGAHKTQSLTLYSPEEHFPWDWLPIWANACIFKRGEDWFCSSIPPKWDAEEGAYKVARLAETYVLPGIVTENIYLTVEDKDSLFLSGAYGDEV